MIVIIDNGHGADTPGKRSPLNKMPDGSVVRLFEYEFNRDIVRRITDQIGFLPYVELVPEVTDISLKERVKRANEVKEPCFLVSIHANAGGGSGFEVFTSKGDTKADPIATIFFEEAQKEFPHRPMRKDMVDGDPDKEADFYILKNTKMLAVLTENFFMDNYHECTTILMTEEGRQKIADFHVRAIRRVFNEIML